jgi:hypothetical protein
MPDVPHHLIMEFPARRYVPDAVDSCPLVDGGTSVESGFAGVIGIGEQRFFAPAAAERNDKE